MALNPEVANFLNDLHPELASKVKTAPPVPKRITPVPTVGAPQMSREQVEALLQIAAEQGLLQLPAKQQEQQEQQRQSPLVPRPQQQPSVPRPRVLARPGVQPRVPTQITPQMAAEIADVPQLPADWSNADTIPAPPEDDPPVDMAADNPIFEAEPGPRLAIPEQASELLKDTTIELARGVRDWFHRTPKWSDACKKMWSDTGLPTPWKWPHVKVKDVETGVMAIVDNDDALLQMVRWANSIKNRVWGHSTLGRFIGCVLFSYATVAAVAMNIDQQRGVAR